MRKTVRCLLKDKDWNFLLVKHPESNFWTLPWWHLEAWENLINALKREIKEEFNFDINVFWKKIWLEVENIFEFPNPITSYKIHYISNKYWYTEKIEYIFLAEIIWWKIKVQRDEIDDFSFYSKKEILNLKKTHKQIKQIVSSL